MLKMNSLQESLSYEGGRTLRNHNRRSKGPVAGPRKDNHPRGNSSPYFTRHRRHPAKAKNSGGGKVPDLYDDFVGSKAKAHKAAADEKAERAAASQQAVAEVAAQTERERKRQRDAFVAQKLRKGYKECKHFRECGGIVHPDGQYCDTADHYNSSGSSWSSSYRW